jgi:ABC-2 type transport system permease protein
MTAFTNHFLFEFKAGLRNSAAMLVNYLLPLAFYAAMGFVMVEINPGFTELLLPSMVVFAIMSSTILGLPNPLVENREAGIYRSFKINGVPAMSILTIPTISTIFHSMIVSAIIMLTAAPIFDADPVESWSAFILITLLTAFTFGTLGMLIGVVSTSARSVVLWSQLIYLPSILLGGMMIPLEIMPETVRAFSGLIPSTYVMQAFFGFAYHQETVIDPWLAVGVLIASGILALGLSIYLFNWDSNNQTRRASAWFGLLILLPYLAAIAISFIMV